MTRSLKFIFASLIAATLAGCERPDFLNFIASYSDFKTTLSLKVEPNHAKEAEALAQASQKVYGTSLASILPGNPCRSPLRTTLEGLHEPPGFNEEVIRKQLTEWLIADGFIKRVSYQMRSSTGNPVYSCVVFTERLKELKLREANTAIADVREANIVLGRRVLKGIISQNSYEITMPMRFTVYRAVFDYKVQIDFPALEFGGTGQGVMEVYKDPQTTRWTTLSFSLSDPVPQFRNPPTPELSKNEALTRFTEASRLCPLLPVGLYKINSEDQLLDKILVAMERAKIIRIAERNDQTSLQRTELVSGLDINELDKRDGKPCLKQHPLSWNEISRLEKIQLTDPNGTISEAYIAYATYTFSTTNTLVLRFRKEMGWPELEKLRKARGLLKYNAQKSQWEVVTFDLANATAAEFETDRVGTVLRRSQSR